MKFAQPVRYGKRTCYFRNKHEKKIDIRLPSFYMLDIFRARKLYTSARIYEWKFGKGKWKLPFASPTGRVDFFGFVIIFEERNELTSMIYSLQKQRKHSEERSFGRFNMSLKCERMFTLVSSKCNRVKSGRSLN